MVKYQTSKYKVIHFIFYVSCLGVFQYIRDIVTVLIDHPVLNLFVVCPKFLYDLYKCFLVFF